MALTAKLDNEGKLYVDSASLVTNLNSEMLGGVKNDQFLRSDADDSLDANKTLTVNGTVAVAPSTGKLKVGSMEIKATASGISIGF